ncbi:MULTISPECIES: DeoR/GlpR family DNA-binding transcription regulator [unclassified Rhizobium]|uniref:DeoR/GlpR family DNA-binding transcription regulator n=1 Tax=unclassified Rhizobium TaxID=2613769 RepID=UPI0015CF1D8E|nr:MULTISPECIES: DeoR/GlpR family DNA-binding transcription regulator [unclassified Rhizobium]MDF0661636.1 DeoR family transcriptional regulator [Rhizobium sp. BC49]
MVIRIDGKRFQSGHEFIWYQSTFADIKVLHAEIALGSKLDSNSSAPPAGDLLVVERRIQIKHLIATMGRVSSRELASRFCVSEDTIRRDLRALNRAGAALKVYGGAVRTRGAEMSPFPVPPTDAGVLVAAAIRLICPNQSIYLDESAESVAVAGALSPALNLTVTTNSSCVLRMLDAQTREVIFLGGLYDFERSATFGSASISLARNLHFDVSVLGDCLVDIDCGLVSSNFHMAELKSVVAERSNAIALLTTGALIGTAPFMVAPINKVKYIISKHAPDEHVLGALADQGIRWETV